jgi:CMP/dCMP kinase
MIIAVDGPTASGKGTVAAGLAKLYGLKRLDTGALYRAVGLAVLDAGADPGDEAAAIAAARALDLASKVAAMSSVRAALLEAQRAFAADPAGAVLDGRDIGTVICPDAEVKLYVTASLPVRTERRLKELRARGEAISFEDLQSQIAERDARDMNRADSPLRQTEGAHLLDTSELSIDEAVAAARRIVEASRRR